MQMYRLKMLNETVRDLLIALLCLMPLFPLSQLGVAYVSATTGAVVTALGLKSLATV